jgi:hypothetical protein
MHDRDGASADEPIDHAPEPDAAFAAVSDLLATITDPKRSAVRLRGLEQELAAIVRDERSLDALQASFDENEKNTLQNIQTENEALTKRRGTIHSEEAALVARNARLGALQKSWRNFQESDDVCSGLHSPALSPLEKAKIAFGIATPEAPPADAHYPGASHDRYATPPDELQRARREGLRRQSRSAAIRGR